MTTITKAEFDALPKAMQSLCKADESGEKYILAVETEDSVSGLKAKNAELLKEAKEAKAKAAELERKQAEIDKANESAEDEKAKAAGQFAELEKKLRDRIAEVEKTAADEKASMMNTILTERVQNLLVSKGMLADRAEYALPSVKDKFELGDDLSLRVKGGIGDAKEIDTLVGELQQKTPWFFESKQAAGSGASGSSFNGGGGKTMTREAFSQLPATEQMAFSKKGGTLTD